MTRNAAKITGIILALLLVLAFPAWAAQGGAPAPEELMEAEDPGSGEEPAGDPYTLAPITVTSQKREEKPQQIPSAISVISETKIEEERIREFRDLSNRVPNLNINGAGGPAIYSSIGIRGRINSMGDMDPTVTVLVDGVPYDDFYAISAMPLFGVERIEVLRGPQSTMYGLNSQAGVINIISQKPGNTPRFHLGLETSSTTDGDWGGLITGSASGPLIEDKLAVGASFILDQTANFLETQKNDERYGKSRTAGGRFSAVFTPSDDFEATLNLGLSRVRADNGFMTLATSSEAAAVLGQKKKHWESDINETGHSEVDTYSGDLSLRYSAGFADIISVTAMRKADQYYLTDMDGYSYSGMTQYDPMTWYPIYPYVNTIGTNKNQIKTFTQELRVQSPSDDTGPLQWLGGFFFNDFSRDRKMKYGDGTMRNALGEMLNAKLSGKSYALFGQATYRLFEQKLGLTVGLRQEWTERELHDRLYFTNGNLHDTDSIFLPKFSVDYRFTPEIMAYATVAMGWRTGGIYSNAAAASSKKENLFYDKETNWTYEVGVKSELFDKRLLLNAAVFYSVYKDYQDLYQFSFMESYLNNAGEARMTGFELEAEGRITDNLTATLGIGYVHARYEEYTDAFGNDYSGKRVTNVPDFDLNFAVKYSFLDNFYVRPELRVVGTSYWDRANKHRQDPYATFNMRAGYMHNNFEVYIYGENLTNEYAFTTASDMLGNGYMYGTPIRPLEVGLGISFYF